MTDKKGEPEKTSSEDYSEGEGFFGKYGASIVLAGLVIYVILLAIGVFAEVFRIQSVLDWWLWRPAGI